MQIISVSSALWLCWRVWMEQRSGLYRVGPKSGTFYSYVNMMPYKLQNTGHLYCSNKFSICFNYWQLRYAHLIENVFIILSEHRQCFSTRRLWIKQRSSSVNSTVVTKLQFIHIKTELVYIGGWRTTSFDENGSWVNKNGEYNASNNG